MPHLYPHKRCGWRIVYRVYFPDGTEIERERYARKLAHAQRIHADVDALETLTRRSLIMETEVRRALNLKYITPEEAALLFGRHVAGAFTWNQLRKKYEDAARSGTAKTTYKSNRSKIDRVVEYFSQFDPAEVTVDHIKKYFELRRKGLVKLTPKKHGRKLKDETAKDATLRKELVVLRYLLDPLGEGNNPAREVPLPEVNEEKIPRPLYRYETGIFMDALDARKTRLYGDLKQMTMIYLYAGLRPSEIVRLVYEDLNTQANKIHVQGPTKTGYARSVDIHPRLRPYLDELLGRAKQGEKLFQCDANSLGREIAKVISKAGLKGVTPYSLRHSFVTYLLLAGADLRKTMELAGHKKLATTTRYLHTVPTVDSPVNKIDFGMGETLPNKTPKKKTKAPKGDKGGTHKRK